MAYAAMKPTKAGLEDAQEQIHKIRITLSSKNVKNLEKGKSLPLCRSKLLQLLSSVQVGILFLPILRSNSNIVYVFGNKCSEIHRFFYTRAVTFLCSCSSFILFTAYVRLDL